MKTMGDRIRDRLKEIDKSQHWLAAEVGIKQPSLNKIIKAGTGTKHTVALAKALGVFGDWLTAGTGPKLLRGAREAVLVGKIGAGAKVIRTEEGVVMEGGIEPPAGHETALAALIEGDSMLPLEAGWLVFYASEQGFDQKAINRLSAVGLMDGTVYIKKLRRVAGKYRLDSWNSDPIENAKVAWASPIIEIRPV